MHPTVKNIVVSIILLTTVCIEWYEKRTPLLIRFAAFMAGILCLGAAFMCVSYNEQFATPSIMPFIAILPLWVAFMAFGVAFPSLGDMFRGKSHKTM